MKKIDYTHCDKCPLKGQPHVPGWGEAGGGVMIVGEAPDEDAAKQGRPLIGDGGRFLSKLVKLMGFDRANTYDTYVVKCQVPHGKKPNKKSILCCMNILAQEIVEQKPEIIITLGGMALHQFISGKIVSFHGTRMKTDIGQLIPMFNPMNAKPILKSIIEADFKSVMKRPFLQSIGGTYMVGTPETAPKAKKQAIDAETEGLDRGSPLIGAGFGTEGVSVYLEAEDTIRHLQQDIPDTAIMHNAKFDLQVFAYHGIPINKWKRIDDPMVLAYCMNRPNLGLKDLALQEMNLMMPRYEDVCPEKGTLRDVPVKDVAEYCGSDCDGTDRLFTDLWSKATKRERELYEKVDRPTITAIADMELQGMKLDLEYLNWEKERILQEMGGITAETESKWGLTATIMGSPKQLGNFINDVLKIPLRRKTKGTGQWQADAEVLYPLINEHPAIAKMLKWKELEKLRGTYIEGILKRQKDGILHTTFNQCRTASGRLSSSNPNLQVLPHTGGIRKMIIAEDGFRILEFDLSQIELRIVAHVSQDKRMLEIFAKGDIDIHSATSDLIFGDHTPDHRWIAKQANYAITYGGTYRALLGGRFIRFSDNVITQDVAEFVFARYFELFPGVADWLDYTKDSVKRNGYVDTLYGRRRYFPQHESYNPYIITEMEREAVNHIPQGTCADIVRMQMPKACEVWTPFLQVHDSLAFHVPEDLVERLIPAIRCAMLDIDVPFEMKIDCKVGKNFGEMKEVDE